MRNRLFAATVVAVVLLSVWSPAVHAAGRGHAGGGHHGGHVGGGHHGHAGHGYHGGSHYRSGYHGGHYGVHHRGYYGGHYGGAGFHVGLGYNSFNRSLYWPSTRYRYYGAYAPYYAPYYDNYGYGPHGVYYRPRSGQIEYYLPSSHVPAELHYGPQAVKQFMGVDRNFGMGRLSPPAALPKIEPVPKIEPKVHEFKPAIKEVSTRSDTQAGRLIKLGDIQFAKQKYYSALQRYKEAVAASPKLAEAQFRRGIGYLISGDNDRAVDSIRRGLELDSAWIHGDFGLDSLYGGARIAKTGHLESLAGNAWNNPADAKAMYVLGVFLYLDGQRDRSRKFFQRASELTDDRRHIRPFLRSPKIAAADGSIAL